MPPRPLRTAVSGAALLLAALLAACVNRGDQFPPACPQTTILSDAADVTIFRGNGTDITDTAVDGRITGLSGQCKLDDPTHLRTTISVGMDISRGPAARGRAEDVTYFISVSRGDNILDKRDYPLHVEFPRNTDTVRLEGEQVDLVLPVNDKLSGAAYNVRVGFQLNEAQLAFNRRRGPR